MILKIFVEYDFYLIFDVLICLSFCFSKIVVNDFVVYELDIHEFVVYDFVVYEYVVNEFAF